MQITHETRALVMGANGGLGQAITEAFVQRGARVAVSGRRADALEPVRARWNTEVVLADLLSRTDVERLALAAREFDVLVLNAALPASGPIHDFPPDDIDRALEVNLRAPIHIASTASRAMVERGYGQIVFISSIAGKVASHCTAIYSATKFGLRGFAQGLRADLREHGVGVTTVFPGFIRDAGMFADTGTVLPFGAGTRSPQDVAQAVLRAVEHNPAELDVAAFEQRLGGWLGNLFPDFVAAVQRAAGGNAVATRISAGQRHKR
ncbi:MAG TPA: SDR family NAD(P)-dependent oxidoreductase [Polyangiales bacterium]|nr:SDR family NAD(P)-dependent oxidoreductase [Polyangiales bacterium]